MKKIRIVLVDDHVLFHAGLKLMLENLDDMEVVGEASTGREALKLTAALKPDVLLLDLTLPDVSGISIIGDVMKASPRTHVLILTMHDEAALVRAALAAGAKGYLVKTAMDTELIAAVRSVARGRMFVNLDLPPDQVGALLEDMRQSRPGTLPKGPLDTLSSRERQVLQFLAYGHTNQEIADRLALSVKTVETYRARISEKLGFQSRADLIRFAIESGVLKPGDRPE